MARLMPLSIGLVATHLFFSCPPGFPKKHNPRMDRGLDSGDPKGI